MFLIVSTMSTSSRGRETKDSRLHDSSSDFVSSSLCPFPSQGCLLQWPSMFTAESLSFCWQMYDGTRNMRVKSKVLSPEVSLLETPGTTSLPSIAMSC